MKFNGLAYRCGLTDEEKNYSHCRKIFGRCENIMAFVYGDSEKIDSFDPHYAQVVRDFIKEGFEAHQAIK